MRVLQQCTSLERLSVKNATWSDGDERAHLVSQEMLINMVWHHPSLRWLRSDLAAENITALQQEQPEITFVAE